MKSVVSRLTPDAGHFSPVQLQPAAAFRMAFNATHQWVAERLGVRHAELVEAQQIGFVGWGIHLRYIDPLSYFQANELRVSTAGLVQEDGITLTLTTDVHSKDRRALELTIVLAVLRLTGSAALDGAPARLPRALFADLEADELTPVTYASPVPRSALEIEEENKLLAEGKHSLTIHRHNCEVADQWCYADIPRFTGEAREVLALRQGPQVAELRSTMSLPMQRMDCILRSPFFLFDEMHIRTRLFASAAEYIYIHELNTRRRTKKPAATIIERFAREANADRTKPAREK